MTPEERATTNVTVPYNEMWAVLLSFLELQRLANALVPSPGQEVLLGSMQGLVDAVACRLIQMPRRTSCALQDQAKR